MKRLSERMADDGDMECHVFVDDVAELERDRDAERSRCMDLTARLDRARMELRAAEAARDEATRDRELVSVLVGAVRARLATAEANYQAVAEALGTMYEGDGCASAPGPVVDCVAAIKDLRAFRDAEMERLANLDEARARMRTAARDIVFAMRIYSGYTLTSRGPRGLMWDALEQLAPEVHATVAAKDWDAAWDEHFAPEDPLPLDDDPAAPVDTRTGEVTREWAVGDACEVRMYRPDLAGTEWVPGHIVRDDTFVVEARGRTARAGSQDLRRPIPPTAMEPRMEGGRGLDLDAITDEDHNLEDLARRRIMERADAFGEIELDAARIAGELDRDTRIADLERRLREAEGRRTFMGAPSIAAMSEAELRATVSSQSTAIYELRVELEEAHADEATSLIAATEAHARAERAEERLRRVREWCVGATGSHAWALADVLAIIEEESGR